MRWKSAWRPDSELIDIFGEFKGARKILVLPNDRVGGLFIGAPVYKAIRQSYPEARILLLVDEKKTTLAGQIPFVDEVVTGGLEKSVWSAVFKNLIETLRREEIDLVFCLGADCSFRLAYLCQCSGARLRVGFRRAGMTPFNIEIATDNAGKYEGEQCFCMLRLLGMEGGR